MQKWIYLQNLIQLFLLVLDISKSTLIAIKIKSETKKERKMNGILETIPPSI